MSLPLILLFSPVFHYYPHLIYEPLFFHSESPGSQYHPCIQIISPAICRKSFPNSSIPVTLKDRSNEGSWSACSIVFLCTKGMWLAFLVQKLLVSFHFFPFSACFSIWVCEMFPHEIAWFNCFCLLLIFVFYSPYPSGIYLNFSILQYVGMLSKICTK